jgi:hypothetical protein
MIADLWVYDGSLDAAENVLTLNAEGPSFAADGKLVQYRDVITLETDDHRVLTSRVLADDGKWTWTQFMAAHYRRRK